MGALHGPRMRWGSRCRKILPFMGVRSGGRCGVGVEAYEHFGIVGCAGDDEDLVVWYAV